MARPTAMPTGTPIIMKAVLASDFQNSGSSANRLA